MQKAVGSFAEGLPYLAVAVATVGNTGLRCVWAAVVVLGGAVHQSTAGCPQTHFAASAGTEWMDCQLLNTRMYVLINVSLCY